MLDYQKSFGQILGENTLDELFKIIAEVIWTTEFSSEYISKDSHWVIGEGKERSRARIQLIHENSKRPNVHRKFIPAL